MSTAHVIFGEINGEFRLRVMLGEDRVTYGWHTVATVGEALRFAACRGGFVSWREGVAP